MPFFAGLAQGFNDALTQNRQLEATQANYEADREHRTLQILATQTEHPDIQAAALAGMMSHATTKPARGMKGFFGEMDKSPQMDTVKGLLARYSGGASGAGPATAAGPPSTDGTPPSTQGGGETPAPFAALPGALSAAGTPAAMPTTTAITPGGGGISSAAAAAAPPPASRPGSMTFPGAATPPPSAAGAFASNAPMSTPAEKVRNEAQAKIEGTMAGVRAAYGSAGLPDESMAQLAAAHAMGLSPHYTTDNDGTVHVMVGSSEFGRTTGAGKASGPEAQILTQVRDLMAKDPSLTVEAATQQARAAAATATQATQSVAGSKATTAAATAALAPEMAAARLAASKQTTLTGQAREKFMAAETVRAWEGANGTTPMNESQRINAARSIAGNGPEVTEGDIGRIADRLKTGGAGPAVTTPAPAKGGAASNSAQGPAAAPPPGPVEGAIQAAGGAATARTPKYYSPAGKQTIMAVNMLNSMLPKLEATIRQAGLANDNNALSEGIAKKLYAAGFAPNDTTEQILQRSGMAEAYGLRGLLGGRTNQSLQGIMQMHLVSPGDSPKLILQKIKTLREAIPDITSAVDKSENMRVGGQGGGATPPPDGSSPNGTVRMRAPDGRALSVPASEVARLKALGAVVVQ